MIEWLKAYVIKILCAWFDSRFRRDRSKGLTVDGYDALNLTAIKKSGFLNDPYWDDLPGGYFAAVEDLKFYSAKHNRVFVLEAGIPVNFASTPRTVRLVWPVLDETRKPAALHDGFYAMRGKLPDGSLITKRTADKIFFEALIAEGTSEFKAWAFYRGVRSLISRIKYGRGWPKNNNFV